MDSETRERLGTVAYYSPRRFGRALYRIFSGIHGRLSLLEPYVNGPVPHRVFEAAIRHVPVRNPFCAEAAGDCDRCRLCVNYGAPCSEITFGRRRTGLLQHLRWMDYMAFLQIHDRRVGILESDLDDLHSHALAVMVWAATQHNWERE